MRSRFIGCVLLLAAVGLSAPAQLEAKSHPEVESPLHCQVVGRDVHLSWDIVFFAPIKAWVIHRDGERIAVLDPGANSYVDRGVPEGEHLYTLSAINEIDGSVGRLGSCRVVVGDFGIRCAADGNEVKIAWDPLPILIVIDAFAVRRNGILVALVPADRLEYTDTVPAPGTYRYTVHAVASWGQEFLVGACTVRVGGGGGLQCKVDPPFVHLDWSGAVLPAIVIRFFAVIRDGELIARTERSEYTDTPGPGEHRYMVVGVTGPIVEPFDAGDLLDGPVILVGECTVFVPGGELPPPEDLTCLGLDPPAPTPELEAVLQDAPLGSSDVLLVWQIPDGVEYESVLITRDGAFLARIPGRQFYYIDRNVPPGRHVYEVRGTAGGAVSPPATCEVILPFPPVPPPRDLVCEFLPVVEPEPGGVVPPDDGLSGGIVVLSWTNGASYDFVVVVRNGERLARLPGDATRFVDRAPLPGVNRYGVFGVVGFRRSEAAECRVEVPPGKVPPVEDLTCAVALPGAADPVVGDAVPGGDVDGDIVPVPTVFLRWRNPVVYDAIIVARNNLPVATLPGTAESYIDHPPVISGTVTYAVFGVIQRRRSEPATCEVEIGPPVVPPPLDFRCELVTLPPPVPLPEPLLEAGDEPEIPPEPEPELPPIVRLSWINPVPYRALVVLRDGEVIAELPGEAMTYFDRNVEPGLHVYGIFGIGRGGAESPTVECKIEVPPLPVPPVQDLTCAVLAADVAPVGTAVLKWVNPIAYDRLLIVRNEELIATLPGEAEGYEDPGLEPGVYEYCVIGLLGGLRSPPSCCRVVVEGPVPENLLYFSSGLFEPVEDLAAVPEPVDLPGRITALASNAEPLQAWSFGVCHDPAFLEAVEATIEGTEVALLNEGEGPGFLDLDILDNGVTMAAIVDPMDPADTLPPARRHSLLRIRYEAGPEGEPGVRYPVRYCGTLGDPPVAVLFVVAGFEVRPATRPGFVVLPRPIPRIQFVRGDVNGDFVMDMTDAILTLDWLFRGGAPPGCLEAADANGSHDVNIADPVYNLQFNFAGGPPPPAPFPDCGPARLFLGCEEPPCPIPE